MELQQELEWHEAQKIVISENLVIAAKQQCQFLKAVDGNHFLHEGPVLHRAVYRYNACWLPLLAKHLESRISEGPLVVPLDCEWIWHCHRLNPVQYKYDCEELYGRILDNHNILSSVQMASKKETEIIWKSLFPEEPYELDSSAFSAYVSAGKRFTKYDLVSAVQRQIPFFYQVSRPHMSNDLFLQESVARYKGFLHLIKRNKEKKINCFCVPTYDIDLVWHSHLLYPASYCKDLIIAHGKVLEHDDTDSDRTNGKKLDSGFSETTMLWEEIYGLRYWRAGVMYRGNAPTPLILNPLLNNISSNEVDVSNEWKKTLYIPQQKFVEVLVEIVSVKNISDEDKGSLSVIFTKKQHDIYFDAKQKLAIFSETGNKKVASFQCEPTGELLFELISHSSFKPSFKSLGSSSVSLEELLAPCSKLSVEKWLELMPNSRNVRSNPICLRIAISVTVPSLSPHELRMVRSQPFFMNSCFPLPGKVQRARSWTRIIDEAGNEIIRLQIRGGKKAKERGRDEPVSSKQVVGITNLGEKHTLAELRASGWSFMGWSFMDSDSSPQLHPNSMDEHIFSMKGNTTVMFFCGRKMEYEYRCCESRRNENEFITAVEISADDPFGKAVGLLDLRFGILKVKEEWFVVPGIVVALMLSNDASMGEENIEGKLMLGGGGIEAFGSAGCGGGSCGGNCGGGGCGNMVRNGGKPGSLNFNECAKINEVGA